MNDKPDRLKLLKGKYLSQISEKEKDLSALREKVRLIDELETDAEGLTSATNGTLKYATGKHRLIDAALETLKLIGANGVTASKIAKHIKDHGFPVKGKNFVITVGTSLRRLEQKGEIKSERVDGSRIFMPKT